MIEPARINDAYAELFEINSAIVGMARERVADLRQLAELHRAAADGYDEIADALAEMAMESARMISQGIAVETGLRDLGDDSDE